MKPYVAARTAEKIKFLSCADLVSDLKENVGSGVADVVQEVMAGNRAKPKSVPAPRIPSELND